VKVLLTKNVKGLGNLGDLVDVADGYARNKLIPEKLAIKPTKGAVSQYERLKQRQIELRQKQLEEARAIADKLNEKTLQIAVKAGASGKMFGSVTAQDIEEALLKDFDIRIDKKQITIKNPIKSLGTHMINLELHPEKTIEIQIEVIKAP
jgi:large subunit ribosomal protein L9